MNHGAGPQDTRSRGKWWLLAVITLPAALGAGLYLNYVARAHDQPSPAPEKPVVSDSKPANDPKKERPAPNQLAQEERIRAPELEGGSEWLNCGGPIRMKDLRGKVVLLDFWTYCCINCIHVLPDLARLEKKYPNELVVIGVHSAKFDTEKDSKSIREAILRYHIEHPVVNDADHKIWRQYAVRSWPTFWLIDPEGYLFGTDSGEGLGEALDRAITHLIEVHRKKKTLNEQPLRFDLDKFRERKDAPLYFPGKLLADALSNRLFIADSSHHRLVITDLAGKTLDVIGAGLEGRDDGSYDQATFSDPQGMALDGNTLYVADRKNHLLRAVDLIAKKVTTIAGTGKQGRDRRLGGKGIGVALNSPWDLWLQGGHLYIAMAGHHQLWRMHLKTQEVVPWAGNGREDIFDGTLARSMFAQPSGLTTDGSWLYVADSEVSAVRAVSLKEDGTVKTLVGEGLFDFGDEDGVGEKAKLQHCLGVAFHGGKVYVADTYNNKIKTIDPQTRECLTFVGDRLPGKTDDPPRFDEPAGIAVSGDELFVADTNNHLIRVVNLKSKKVRTLQITGLTPPKPLVASKRPVFLNPVTVKLGETAVPADGDMMFQVKITLPAGMKLSPLAPLQYVVETMTEGGGVQPLEHIGQLDQPKSAFDILIPAVRFAGAKAANVSLAYVICAEGGEGVCQLKSQIWEIPLRQDAAAKERVIQLRVESVEKGPK